MSQERMGSFRYGCGYQQIQRCIGKPHHPIAITSSIQSCPANLDLCRQRHSGVLCRTVEFPAAPYQFFQSGSLSWYKSQDQSIEILGTCPLHSAPPVDRTTPSCVHSAHTPNVRKPMCKDWITCVYNIFSKSVTYSLPTTSYIASHLNKLL